MSFAVFFVIALVLVAIALIARADGIPLWFRVSLLAMSFVIVMALAGETLVPFVESIDLAVLGLLSFIAGSMPTRTRKPMGAS